MKPSLVIMAAGMGSRYGGIKQIDPMGPHGEIVLDYSVYDAIKAGFQQVVFIIRHDIEEAFRQRVGTRFENKISVRYAFQELHDLPLDYTVPKGRQKPWGTGHALLACRDIVKNPFLIINADDFYGAQAFALAAEALREIDPQGLEGFLVSYPLLKTLSPHGYVTRGVCESQDDYLKAVKERSEIGYNHKNNLVYQEGGQSFPCHEKQWVSMNFWGLTPAIFPLFMSHFETFLAAHSQELKSEYLMPKQLDTLLASGNIRIKMLRTHSSWFGVTFPQDKAAVQQSLAELIEKGHYPSPLY